MLKYLSKIVFLLLVSSTYAQNKFEVDFSDGKSVTKDITLYGNKKCLAKTNGNSLYKSANGNIKKYRRMGYTVNEPMAGNFTVDFSFNIKRMDHWNGLHLRITSARKVWSVIMQRRQKKVGHNEFVIISKVNGKSKRFSIKTTTKNGAMRIVRQDNIISFYTESDNDKWGKYTTTVKVDNKAAIADIQCWSPPQTSAIIEFRKLSVEFDKTVTTAFTPIYLPSSKIADFTNNKLKLLITEKAVKKNGSFLKISPGGRAVYAIQGPLNLKNIKLQWLSSGPLKISVTQLGTAESIELGETLLWDGNNKKIPSGIVKRHIYLNDFTMRYPRARRWKLPHQTANNIFFITFEPAQAQAVTIEQLELYGRTLKMVRPFKTISSTSSMLISKDNYSMLDWKIPEQCRKWFDKNSSLKPGETRVLGGIPFKICPTVLNPECRSVAIATDVEAGLINIAHAAGPGYKRTDSLLASYLIVYDDNTTEVIFAVLRWNCGVFSSRYMKNGKGDSTWWGPPGFSWGTAAYLPVGNGIHWNTVYVAKYVNPYPKKKIKKILIYQQPEEKRTFAVVGITLTSPKRAEVGLVEPIQADIEPGKPQRITVMRWSAIAPAPAKTNVPLQMTKTDKKVIITNMDIVNVGNFSYGSVIVSPDASLMEPGPIRLFCGRISSSRLGWMPPPNNKISYYTMIAGGHESKNQLERIKRLGYDAIKIHVGWTDREEPEQGKYDWSLWYPRLERIINAGLKIGIRNHFNAGPKWLQAKAQKLKYVKKGQIKDQTSSRYPYDIGDKSFRTAIVNYYRETGILVKKYPEIISINANYGIRYASGSRFKLHFGQAQFADFLKYMKSNFTLDEINRRTALSLKSYNDITPKIIEVNKSNFLFTEYTRHYLKLGASLQWDIARAIRKNSNAHLTLNHPFEPNERSVTGLNLSEYLKIGRDLGPGSPFHESSDRLCLSFTKWLMAKSLGLQYGDEGNKNPPNYEHNILSYMWMAWMQCWDSLYCQWWGGRPGSQNIAWLKPYAHLLYNSDYMADPITIAYSFESGLHEAKSVMNKKYLHRVTLGHYGMVNTLLGANLNAKNYMMDDFPKLDKNASKLVIDDSCRYLTDQFADRLEKYIRNGGVYVINPETDKLHAYAFQKRFGITIGKNYIPSGRGIRIINVGKGAIPTVAEKNIGKGKLLILNKQFWRDFNPSAPKYYQAFMRKLFANLGKFKPLVFSNTQGVYLAPYRTPQGDILLFAINITAAGKNVELALNKSCVNSEQALDLGSGKTTIIKTSKSYYHVNTIIPELSCKIIKFNKKVIN